MRLRIKYRAFNAGGKGGQHNNRTYSAIEATTTLPDGRLIRAQSKSSKSQHRNKKAAANLLRVRVLDALRTEKERQITAGWGDASRRVRTYHEPDNRVTDTMGDRFTYSEIVGKCNIAPVLESRRRAALFREDA